MHIDMARDNIEALCYKPGWSFVASDHSKRFEGSIKVRITYPARNSDRSQAREGYPTEITTYAEFAMMVGDIMEINQLLRRLINAILKIEEHESREFLRVRGTYSAPFHPHTIEGMTNWNRSNCDTNLLMDMSSDMQFGVA